MRSFLLALAVVSLAACDSSTEYIVGGTYSVSQNIGVGTVTSTITLPETINGERLTSTSSIATDVGGTTDTETLSGTGTYDHPTLTLTSENEAVIETVGDDGGTISVAIDGGVLVHRRQSPRGGSGVYRLRRAGT